MLKKKWIRPPLERHQRQVQSQTLDQYYATKYHGQFICKYLFLIHQELPSRNTSGPLGCMKCFGLFLKIGCFCRWCGKNNSYSSCSASLDRICLNVSQRHFVQHDRPGRSASLHTWVLCRAACVEHYIETIMSVRIGSKHIPWSVTNLPLHAPLQLQTHAVRRTLGCWEYFVPRRKITTRPLTTVICVAGF